MKQPIRIFSLGLLTATLILFLVYWNSNKAFTTEMPELSDAEMIKTLENKGYSVLSYKELEEIKNEQSHIKNDDKQMQQKTETISYAIDITPGTTSRDISNKLEETNIIEDSEAFDQFMRAGNYSRFIQIGQVMLNSDMTNKEIAEAITSK